MRKQILTIEEQIAHLKDNGIKFDIVDEDVACDYLENNNYYFKLASYRKNYDKHVEGKNAGKYINLDFAYLMDLAIIDMNLRYVLIQLALDVEHFVKLDLMKLINVNNEDGYSVVEDYKKQMDDVQSEIFKKEISRNNANPFCNDMYLKYENEMPVWVMLELIPFGRLVSFYKYCSERYDDERMRSNYHLLLMCKDIRNAAAHSSCILNNLRSKTAIYRTSAKVIGKLKKISKLNANHMKNRMSNIRIQEIVTLFYTHNLFVTSKGVTQKTTFMLQDLKNRMIKNRDYYANNSLVYSSINFIELIIDDWF